MPIRRGALCFFTTLSRHFSSSSSTAIATKSPKKAPNLQCINQIPSKAKSRALDEAQKALREYLHATVSVPFVFADLIAKNSPFSLSKLLIKVYFSTRTFSASLTKLLRYEPINEFEFFLESIGIDYDDVLRILPRKKFFFSEDRSAIDAAFTLFQFGFPWNTLGKLYLEEVGIFRCSPEELNQRFFLFKERYCFDNLSLIGVCLAFPRLLREGEPSGNIDAMFEDMRRVYVGFDVGICIEGNVDAWYELCYKVKIFYDLNCEKGKVGELMCRNKDVFLRFPKEVILQKAGFFTKFDVAKVEIGMWLLKSPEILDLDVENPMISVSGLLRHFGLELKELQRVQEKYPYVFGRNKLANLPLVTKALDLHQWCFEKIKGSNGELLATYSISVNEGVDRDFVAALNKVQSTRLARHTMSKVEFLKEIGFGENTLTLNVLSRLHGTNSELQERFNLLLHSGIEHSRLCAMVHTATKILAQNPEKIMRKLNFLCGEMGHSLEYLDEFPKFLYFDLENRIKRRYRCYVWLRESKLRITNYGVSSLIASSEKKFVEFLSDIHPAAPKHYFERFYCRVISDED